MKNYVCPDCGKKFNEGALPDMCPNCGCPKDAFKEVSFADRSDNVSPTLESSNNFGAEHTANGLAAINLVIGILIGVIGLIAGFNLIPQGGPEALGGILCIVFGLLFFLLALISWAFIKLLVNISYRLTRLDNKYNPQ